jgi:hypothetical protein
MKIEIHNTFPPRGGKSRAAFTLMELLISFAVALVVITGIAAVWLYTEKTYLEVSNYTAMIDQSRKTLDIFGKDIRNSSALVAFSTNNPSYLELTNATLGVLYTITYNTNTSQVTIATTGQGTTTNLTGCDSWSFSLYSRAPNLNNFTNDITFYPSTNTLTGQLDPTFCKLIYVNWICSRTILGVKLNTEDVQTAEIVLRNQVAN